MPARLSFTNRPNRRRVVSVAIAIAALGGLAYGGEASLSSSAEQTYQVQPGDSLWSISQRYGVSVDQLAAANDMQLSDVLLIGRTIAIPATSSLGTSDATQLGTGATTSTAPASGGCPTSEATGPWGVLPAMSDSEAQLRPEFVEWADAYGVSPALVEAIAWQESGWQQGVVSGADAIGVGQLLPSTATFVGDRLLGERLDIHDTDENIQMMARFVAYLSSEESGNLCDTIAAYYEGPANVSEHGVLPVSTQYIADVEALMPRFE